MRRVGFATRSCWRIDAAGVVFCVGVSLLAYFAALRPLVRQHVTVAEQKRQLAVQQQKASRLSGSVLALKRQLAQVRRVLRRGSIELKPLGRINQRIAEFSKPMERCGLKVDKIELQTVIHGSRYDVVPVKLVGQGGYKACVAFIHELCESFADAGVRSFEMSGSPQGSKAGGKFRIDLMLYASPEQSSSSEQRDVQ